MLTTLLDAHSRSWQPWHGAYCSWILPLTARSIFWIRNWISTQASGHHVIKYPQGIDTPSTKHKNWNLDEIYSTLISPFVNWWFFGPSGEPKVQCPKSSTAFWARAPVHLAAHIVPTHSEPQACCSFPKKRRNKQWSIFRKQLYIPIWRLLYTKLNFVNWSNILYIYVYTDTCSWTGKLITKEREKCCRLFHGNPCPRKPMALRALPKP